MSQKVKSEEENLSETNIEDKNLNRVKLLKLKIKSTLHSKEITDKVKDQKNLQAPIPPNIEQKKDEINLATEITTKIFKKEKKMENETHTKVEILFENIILQKPKRPFEYYEKLPPLIKKMDEFPAVLEEKKELEK